MLGIKLTTAVIAALLLSSAARAGQPDLDLRGNQRYLVILKHSVVEAEPAAGEPPALSTRDPRLAGQPFAWHRPQVRALVKRLEKALNIQAVSMTSWAMETFSAYMPVEVADSLRLNPWVKEILPQQLGGVQFSAWSDYTNNSENISWGKIAIGTDDNYQATSSSTPVYLVDGAAMIDGTYSPHNDNNIVEYAPVNTYCPTCGYYNVDPSFRLAPSHANHVAGILGAARNFVATRGVNPGQPIINVIKGVSFSEIEAAFDWVLKDAEVNNIYAVLNFSSEVNSTASAADREVLWQYFRRASNRVLVVQSAGNYSIDACTYPAYPYTNQNDGILVVGGIDEYGQQAVGYNNSSIGPGWIDQPGSNYGSCVEAWAPAERILSSWNTGYIATQRLSGSSMAAPHVSALALRYGDNTTTPVQREKYIRSHLFATGYSDWSYLPIQVPSYTQPQSFAVPSRLSVASIWTDGTIGSNPWYTVDGLYLNTVYNSGHVAPAFVEYDLGATRTLNSIRMTPEMGDPDSGYVVNQVYVGDTPNPQTLVAQIYGTAHILEPIAASLNNVTGRYVRIVTAANPGWVAWREIELYGY